MRRTIQIGFFRQRRFISAPLQLVHIEHPELVDTGVETFQGHVVRIDNELYWLQRVVYTGIDITYLNQVNERNGTFNAEFYLWMRYGGDDDLPTHVEFSGFSGDFDPAKPLESSQEDGLNYRLYKVNGTFKANFDLHDYPFDSQSLAIHLRNQDHPRDEIAYIIDTFGLQLDRPKLPDSESDAYRSLQLWRVDSVRRFVDSFSISSTLGKPGLFSTANRTEYGGFDTEIVLRRDVAAFMVKTLIAPFLLVLVVFTTLFFPPSLIKERTTIPVTAILTSAVLLISISNQLPPLGYTVALEYLFYVFFALCLLAMTTAFLSEILRHRRHQARSVAMDRAGQIVFVTILLITLVVFWWKFGASVTA